MLKFARYNRQICYYQFQLSCSLDCPSIPSKFEINPIFSLVPCKINPPSPGPIYLKYCKEILSRCHSILAWYFHNSDLLRYAIVDTFIVFHSLTPLLMEIADTTFRKQPCPSKLTFSSLVIIMSGAVGYVMTDSGFTLTAYSWALGYSVKIITEWFVLSIWWRIWGWKHGEFFLTAIFYLWAGSSVLEDHKGEFGCVYMSD